MNFEKSQMTVITTVETVVYKISGKNFMENFGNDSYPCHDLRGRIIAVKNVFRLKLRMMEKLTQEQFDKVIKITDLSCIYDKSAAKRNPLETPYLKRK